MAGIDVEGEAAPSVAGDPRLDAWRAFLVAHATITRALEQELQSRHGMSLAEYDVLVQLSGADGRRLRMSELAGRALLSRSGATRLVDRLVADGLVARDTCESDRRGQWTVLTAMGEERMRQAAPTHVGGVARHFLARIDPEDRRTVAAVMRRLAPA